MAALTDRFAVRGMFPTAAMICTISSGAAALVVISKLTDVAPPGATTVAGTLATSGSLENSSTVVGSPSAQASVTVPVADAPSRTMLGATESDEMAPPASATAGSNSSTSKAAGTASRRRMGASSRNRSRAIRAVRDYGSARCRSALIDGWNRYSPPRRVTKRGCGFRKNGGWP